MNPINYQPQDEKPGEVVTISILTLISGITNIIAGLIYMTTIVIGTLGIGLLCLPFFLLPIALGIFEIIYASKLLSNPPRKFKHAQLIAIFEITSILWLNIISVTSGIISLVFYNKPEIKEYLDRLLV